LLLESSDPDPVEVRVEPEVAAYFRELGRAWKVPKESRLAAVGVLLVDDGVFYLDLAQPSDLVKLPPTKPTSPTQAVAEQKSAARRPNQNEKRDGSPDRASSRYDDMMKILEKYRKQS
jgi:hypothetical protein